MKLDILTSYPFWFVLLCLLAGLAYAMVLYFRNKNDEFSLILKRVLGVLRFISVSILAFLLLSPLIRSHSSLVEQPVVVFLQDNSSSVFSQSDSASMNEYREGINVLLTSLDKDYQVEVFTFGEKVERHENGLPENAFNEKVTDISMAFQEITSGFENQNLGAVILASDGVVNRGNAIDFGRYPVYTITLGDTTRRQDLLIRSVNHNSIAYMENEFPVEIVIQAFGCDKGISELEILREGRVIYSEAVTISGDRFSGIFRVSLTAKEPGIAAFTARLKTVEGESQLQNNQKTFYIDILDARQRILILSHAPHPDVSALKESIRAAFYYEVDDYLAGDFTGNLLPYNLVVLHQLPDASPASFRIMEELADNDIPVLYILGSNTDMNFFNATGSGAMVEDYSAAPGEAQPWLNNDFSLFQLDDPIRRLIPSLPPLFCPAGEYRLLPTMQVLFYQKIFTAETKRPLVFLGRAEEKKSGIIAGEGIWRWRLTDFVVNGTHSNVNQLLSKIFRYLALDLEKKRFRVETSRQYFDNEDVPFKAELYDENFVFLPGNEITLQVNDENGNTYEFVFDSGEQSYELNAGKFPPGIYRYYAKTIAGNMLLEASGEYSVSVMDLESSSVAADHGLLFRISDASGGSMVSAENMASLKELIKQRNDIKPVVYSREKYTDVVSIPWVFVLLLIIITLEWLARKWGGSY